MPGYHGNGDEIIATFFYSYFTQYNKKRAIVTLLNNSVIVFHNYTLLLCYLCDFWTLHMRFVEKIREHKFGLDWRGGECG